MFVCETFFKYRGPGLLPSFTQNLNSIGCQMDTPQKKKLMPVKLVS